MSKRVDYAGAVIKRAACKDAHDLIEHKALGRTCKDKRGLARAGWGRSELGGGIDGGPPPLV